MSYKSYISILFAGILLAVALVAYGVWYKHVSRQTAEAARISEELRAFGDAGGRASSIRRMLEELEHQEALAYARFVGDANIVPFLEEVETTGRSLGAAVEVASVGDAVGKPDQLQMTLLISGSFDAVARTLGALEYSSYDTALQSLTFDALSGESSRWTATAIFLVGKPPETEQPN